MVVPVIRAGYVQWVDPRRVMPGEWFYMLGDHGCFCPVQFEKPIDEL